MTKYNTLEGGLNDLMESMNADMPQWSEKLQHMYYGRTHSSEKMMNLASDTCTEHTVWTNMVGNPYEASQKANTFDEFCWFVSYEQLSEHFGVPLSWVNALSIQARTDPMRMTWRVVGMQLMDDEGYLSESAYAALLDGQDGELLPKESDLSDLRHPDLIKMSQDNNKALTEYAEFYDLDPADARATLQGYDFTLA